MKLRALTSWWTRAGQRRCIRLYKAWRNMIGRTRGSCSRADCDYWRGLEIGFKDWNDFRTWSLANGYSAVNNSLDRKRPEEGYTKDNLQWVPQSFNSFRANYARWHSEREFSTADF